MKKIRYRKNRKKLPEIPTTYELACKAKKAYELEFEKKFKIALTWRLDCINSANWAVGIIVLCVGLMNIIYGIFFDFTNPLLIIFITTGLSILFFSCKDNRIYNFFKKRMKDKYVEEKMKDMV